MPRQKKTAPKKTDHRKIPFPSGDGKPGDGSERGSAPGRDVTGPEAELYHLKLQAVDDLVSANEENAPPVSGKELRKYQSGPRIKVADWVKAILLKIWFAGIVCYFFIWGLSTFTLNQWDLMAILGVALGAVTNLFTNSIYRFIAKESGAYDRWMMFPRKSLAFLPLDILYATLLVLCTVMTYNGINLLAAGGVTGAAPALSVEPILFGVIVTLWDLLFLGMKRLLRRIVRDAREKASAGR